MQTLPPLDLTANGTSVYLTAKRNPLGSGAPVFTKLYERTVGGVVTSDGITIRPDLGTGVFDVLIDADDTSSLTTTTLLAYDVWVKTPQGAEAAIVKGTLKVRARARTPA